MKLTKKELRKELEEIMLPVMENLALTRTPDFKPVFEFEFNGENIQVQNRQSGNDIVVYVMYWHGKAPAFVVTPARAESINKMGPAWMAKEFVKLNEKLIATVHNHKPLLH